MACSEFNESQDLVCPTCEDTKISGLVIENNEIVDEIPCPDCHKGPDCKDESERYSQNTKIFITELKQDLRSASIFGKVSYATAKNILNEACNRLGAETKRADEAEKCLKDAPNHADLDAMAFKYNMVCSELEAANKRADEAEKLAIKYKEEIDKLRKRLGIDNPWHNVGDVDKLKQQAERIARMESFIHKHHPKYGHDHDYWHDDCFLCKCDKAQYKEVEQALKTSPQSESEKKIS